MGRSTVASAEEWFSCEGITFQIKIVVEIMRQKTKIFTAQNRWSFTSLPSSFLFPFLFAACASDVAVFKKWMGRKKLVYFYFDCYFLKSSCISSVKMPETFWIPTWTKPISGSSTRKRWHENMWKSTQIFQTKITLRKMGIRGMRMGNDSSWTVTVQRYRSLNIFYAYE